MTMPDWFDDIEGVFVCVPDHIGRLSGKRVAAHRLAAVLHDGLPMPDFHLVTDLDFNAVPGREASGPESGFRNDLLVPIPGTLRRAPWDPSTAIVLADAYRNAGAHRTLIEQAPRTVLARQVERLGKLALKT
jgi:glutamine synthetase